MKRRYGLIIDRGKPLYFDDVKSRQKIINNIKNRIQYSTFSEKILNPNCSEVIARLPVDTIPGAKKLIKSIGLEVIRFDAYLHMHIHPGAKDSKIEPYNFIIDPDDPNSPDFVHSAMLSICRGNYNESGEGIYIDGHQHCQTQLYPIIKKMQDGLDIEFFGYDGGGNFNEMFDEWLDKGAEKEDFNKEYRTELKKLMNEKKIKEIVENVFDVVDCIESRKNSDVQKYLLLKKAYKEFIEEHREQLIKERRADPTWKNANAGTDDNKMFAQILDYKMFSNIDPLFNIVNNKKLREIVLKRKD